MLNPVPSLPLVVCFSAVELAGTPTQYRKHSPNLVPRTWEIPVGFLICIPDRKVEKAERWCQGKAASVTKMDMFTSKIQRQANKQY